MRYEVDNYIVEHITETNKYYIYFKDSVNNECKIEIDQKIYEAYIESKRAYKKIKNQKTRYEENSEQTEISLYSKSMIKQKSVEDEVQEKIEKEKLKKAKSVLTETQKRRIELYIEEGMSLGKIAQKCIEIGIIKDLYEQGLLTEEEMNLAIRGINEEFERRI